MGEPDGSAFLNCNARELPGRTYPPQSPADEIPGCVLDPSTTKGHTSGTNYAFADTHAKLLSYYQIRKNDFYLFKAQKPTQQYNP